jgi:hypothetical protein
MATLVATRSLASLQVTVPTINCSVAKQAWLPLNVHILLYNLNSLLIDVSTFNEARSVDNVQGEPCPGAGAHHRPQTLRLHRNNTQQYTPTL